MIVVVVTAAHASVVARSAVVRVSSMSMKMRRTNALRATELVRNCNVGQVQGVRRSIATRKNVALLPCRSLQVVLQ
jgi:hypothetical protein